MQEEGPSGMNIPEPFGPVFAVLAKVREHPGYWTACCPAHDDAHPSLSLKVSEGKLLVKCHAGPGATGCPWQAIFAAFASLGVPATAFFADGGKVRKPQIVETNIYRNADGTPRFRTHRWEPGLSGGGKSFTVEHFVGVAWKKGIEPAAPCLSGLDLLAKHPGRAAWLTEGERKAKALLKLGLLATTAPFGAKSAWSPDYTEALRGRPVVLLPDNDEPGMARVRDVGSFLAGAAREVKILELPGLKHKGDVYDFLVSMRWRGCKERLVSLASEAPTLNRWLALALWHQANPDIRKELAALALERAAT